MAKRIVKDIEASIRARLLNLSKTTGENYHAVLLRFFQERFLARLSQSPFQMHFVLKGGLLLLTRHFTTFRPTIDIDMLGISISNDSAYLSTVIEEIVAIDLNDGVRFDVDAIKVTVIKEDAEYEGNRFTFWAGLGKIRARMQLDIGFGDLVPIPFEKKTLLTMLPDFSKPEMLLYPLESVIAEKFQAIVYLGFATSRMKDFYDIIFLAENNTFFLKKLKSALEATFANRKTDIEKRFFIYESHYIVEKEKLWNPFLNKIDHRKDKEAYAKFSAVIQKIRDFIEPAILNKKNDDKTWDPKNKIWNDLK